MGRPDCVKRSSGSRVRFPTNVTLFSDAIACSDRDAGGGSTRRGGPGLRPAAAGLGVGKADQLVADDFVREPERPLHLVEGRALGFDQRVDRVVALGLVLDLVGEAAFTPP